jgi:sugar lactone lactonase YvrE
MNQYGPGPQGAGLAVDSSYVYWTNSGESVMANSGSVVKVPISGGNLVTIAQSLNQPSGLAINASSAYTGVNPSTGTSSLIQIPLTGGPFSTLVQGQPYYVSSVAVSGSYLYWLDTNTSTGTGYAESVLVTNTSQTSDLAPGQDGPVNIVSDSGFIYWTTASAVVKSSHGGTVTTLATSQYDPNGIALDQADQYLYFTNYSNAGTGKGSIARVELSSGTVTTIAPNTQYPKADQGFGIATDGTNVYWTTAGGGTVLKMAVSGGVVSTVASGYPNTSAIVVDGTSVYFTTNGNMGTVTKLTPK